MTMSSAKPFRIITTAAPETMLGKQWIVEGLFAASDIVGLIAPPFKGKSVLALDLGAAIAAGRDWFGRKVSQGAVLYFALERHSVTLRRLRAHETRFSTGPLNVGIVRDRLDLLQSFDAERLLATVEEFRQQTSSPLRLIVIDTSRAAMPGGDENSPRDMGKLAHHLGHIRDGAPDAFVLVIQHTPKGRPTEGSGHTAISAASDVEVVVGTMKGGCGSWRITQANDLQELPPAAAFELQSVEFRDMHGCNLAAPVVVPIVGANGPKPEAAPLPKDAQLVLGALRTLSPDGKPIEIEALREAAYRVLQDRKMRKPDALRKALNNALHVLKNQELITINRNTVSVRMREDA